MSRISFKLFVAGLCLFMASSASAQMSEMRLFSPYPDDQFGGGAYMNEGFYGSVGYGVLSISQAPDQTIGYTGSDDDTTAVGTTIGGWNNTAVITGVPTYSQISTASFESPWVTSSKFEVGNIRGHHGWSVGGTIINPQRTTDQGTGAGIAIKDEECIDVWSFIPNSADPTNFYVFDKTDSSGISIVDEHKTIGRLWGIVGLYGSGTSSNTTSGTGSASSNSGTVDENSVFVFVPIPLTYDMFQLETCVNTWSVEAMYTYRFHPFRRGVLELLAGLRYTVFDEEMDFFGHATTQLTTQYTNTVIDILQQSNIVSNSGSSVVGEGQNFATSEQNNDFSIGSDLGYSIWNFKAYNHLVGPQFGGRYTLSNNRWRFSAEGKFFAALNRQTLRGAGELGLKPSTTQGTNLSNTNGNPMYAPINTVQNHFDYSETYNEFTPAAEVALEATWHWTRCISFKVGYDMLFMGNIARATAFNDYRMNKDGSIFGVKENADDRNFDAFVHGVTFTAQFNK